MARIKNNPKQPKTTRLSSSKSISSTNTSTKQKITKIRKRDGRLVKYRLSRIVNAIYRALIVSNKKPLEENHKLAEKLALEVEKRLLSIFGDVNRHPSVEDIQDLVEAVLLENKLFKVVENYVSFRQQRRLIREEKKAVLNKDKLDDIEKRFSLTAIQVLASRYLIKDRKGNIIEGLRHLFMRTAITPVLTDILFDERVIKSLKKKKGKVPVVFGSENPGQFKFKEDVYDKEVKEFLEKIDSKIKAVPERIEDTHSGFYIGKYPLTYAHLERLAVLYDEAKRMHGVKIRFSKLLDMIADGVFDSYEKVADEYFNAMINQEFMPNSPTLMNAGYRLGQLSACFVLDMEDDLISILNTNTQVGVIFQSGGGVGINYGKLRPEGDVVSSTSGVASGPLSFMEIVNTTTHIIKQGGKRRGANMGVLDVFHPDIEKFITVKEDLSKLTNFNISVGMWPVFWESLINRKRMPLINPRNNEVVRDIDPDHLINRIAFSAHKSAEPGVIFFDRVNEYNVLKRVLGNVRATNPCGEQPLYTYESCNLASINLLKCVKEGKDGKPEFDWRKYYKLIRLVTRFLDSIIDINKYPLPLIRYRTRSTRKIGLGIMGLADMFYKLRIPYNSKEAYELMDRLAEALSYYSMRESVELSKERGAFPLFNESEYSEGKVPVKGVYDQKSKQYDWATLTNDIQKYGIRNSMTTTIAPTGSIAMIADTSTGLEPQFSLAYRKNVAVGSFFITDGVFNEYLTLVKRDSGNLKEIVSNNRGMLTGLDKYFNEEEQRIFITAQEIHWLDHLIAQAVWQRWVSASISKTINMHEQVTVNDIKHAYLLGHELGCKGLTVYREGSRTGVIQFIGEEQKIKLVPSNYAISVVEGILNSNIGIYGARDDYRAELRSLLSDALEGKMSDEQLTIADSANTIDQTKEDENKQLFEVCPECGSDRIVFESGCHKCIDCGWSACTVS